MRVRAVLFETCDSLMLIGRDHACYSPSLKRAYDFLAENGVDVAFEVFEKAYIESRDALYVDADAKLEEPHFNVRIANALKNLGYDHGVSSGVVAGATNAFCQGFMNYVRVDENAKSVLEKLHGRYKLGIVSNFAIPECVLKLLEKEGLARFFDVVIFSGGGNKRRTSPEIFKKALEEMGVDAKETVFVGDKIDADIEGPKSVGMKTIFIERRVQKEVETACRDQTI